jgi:hypothetical protein
MSSKFFQFFGNRVYPHFLGVQRAAGFSPAAIAVDSFSAEINPAARPVARALNAKMSILRADDLSRRVDGSPTPLAASPPENFGTHFGNT